MAVSRLDGSGINNFGYANSLKSRTGLNNLMPLDKLVD